MFGVFYFIYTGAFTGVHFKLSRKLYVPKSSKVFFLL